MIRLYMIPKKPSLSNEAIHIGEKDEHTTSDDTGTAWYTVPGLLMLNAN